MAECLDQLPTRGVAFVSGESRGHDGDRVINRIWQIGAREASGGAFRADVWCMAQRRADETKAQPSLLAITIAAATKKGLPRSATFLQLRKTRAGTYKIVAPQAPCLMCHSNGPRGIRPERVERLPVPNEEETSIIAGWNTEIAGTGEIVGVDPRESGRIQMPPLHLLPSGGGAELKVGMCADCHRSGSGVRSPLRPENEGSIRFLIGGGFDAEGWWKTGIGKGQAMPREREALSHREELCLTRWLESGGGDEACPSLPGGKVKAVTASERANLHVRATVTTSLGSFEVEGIRGNVTVHSRNTLHGELNLGGATTGVSLRDRHMAERVFRGDDRPTVTGTLAQTEMPNGKLVQLQLSWKGRTKKMEFPVQCDLGRGGGEACLCNFDQVPLNLLDFGIEPPRVLWAAVRPVIYLAGTLMQKDDACFQVK